MYTHRRAALLGVFFAALLIPAAAAAADSAAPHSAFPRGAGMQLRVPGQNPYWPIEVTNRSFVNLKWWVPSRAYSRVKFTFSPFGATKTVSVGSSLGGTFRVALIPPSSSTAGGHRYVVPPQGWYPFAPTMTVYKGKRAAGSFSYSIYVDVQEPTVRIVNSTMTIDPSSDIEYWSPPLQLQFDDNFAQGAQPQSERAKVAGILYLKATPVAGGGPAGDGLVGTLLQGYFDGTYSPTDGYYQWPAAPGTWDFLIDPARDAVDAYLPGTYAQMLVFEDTAGNRATETVVFTVLPAPDVPSE